jgi:hypothetical protein
MIEKLTRCFAFRWVIEYYPELAGELLKMVQRRILPTTHSAGPFQGFPGEA